MAHLLRADVCLAPPICCALLDSEDACKATASAKVEGTGVEWNLFVTAMPPMAAVGAICGDASAEDRLLLPASVCGFPHCRRGPDDAAPAEIEGETCEITTHQSN